MPVMARDEAPPWWPSADIWAIAAGNAAAANGFIITPVLTGVVGRATARAGNGLDVDAVDAIDVVTAMIARHFEQRTRKPSGPAASTRLSGITYLARQLRQL